MTPRMTQALTFIALLALTSADHLMPGVRRTERAGSSTIHFPTPARPPNPPRRLQPHPQPQPLPLDGVGDEGAPDAVGLPADFDELDITTLNRLNDITNISDFAHLFDLLLPVEEDILAGPAISSRFGGEAPTEAIELAEMANCKPELVTVPLELPEERNAVYFPTCVRLEQCGGCCYGPLLTCRPTVTKVVRFKVLKTVIGSDANDLGSARRRGGGRRRRRRQNPSSYVEVEAVKHTACQCGCRLTEQDCNPAIHTYYEGECACVCKNSDEKRKCEEQNTTRYWDNDTCSCYCRKPSDCSSGQFFSQATCRCELLTARSGPGGLIGTDEVPSRRPSLPRRRKPVRVPLF